MLIHGQHKKSSMLFCYSGKTFHQYIKESKNVVLLFQLFITFNWVVYFPSYFSKDLQTNSSNEHLTQTPKPTIIIPCNKVPLICFSDYYNLFALIPYGTNVQHELHTFILFLLRKFTLSIITPALSFQTRFTRGRAGSWSYFAHAPNQVRCPLVSRPGRGYPGTSPSLAISFEWPQD